MFKKVIKIVSTEDKLEVFLSSLEPDIFIKLNPGIIDKLYKYLIEVGIQKSKYILKQVFITEAKPRTLTLDFYTKNNEVNLWIDFILDKNNFVSDGSMDFELTLQKSKS